jgi:hypothetical protein
LNQKKNELLFVLANMVQLGLGSNKFQVKIQQSLQDIVIQFPFSFTSAKHAESKYQFFLTKKEKKKPI